MYFQLLVIDNQQTPIHDSLLLCRANFGTIQMFVMIDLSYYGLDDNQQYHDLRMKSYKNRLLAFVKLIISWDELNMFFIGTLSRSATMMWSINHIIYQFLYLCHLK